MQQKNITFAHSPSQAIMSRAAWNISPRAANVTYGKRENFEWEK